MGLLRETPRGIGLLSRSRRRLAGTLDRSERLTLALAALAAGTSGTLVAGEVIRRFRRRLLRARADAAIDHHAPAERINLAGQATQDSLRVAIRGYSAASRTETVLLNMLGSFTLTFGIARLSTTGIRSGWWPLGNLEVGERHIHHFVPGILIAFASGAGAMVVTDEDAEAALAVPFGVGVALTFDEAALLLDLQDVYWTRRGLLSVQLSLGLALVLSAAIVAMRTLRRGEELEEAAGGIPDQSGWFHTPEEGRFTGGWPQSAAPSA